MENDSMYRDIKKSPDIYEKAMDNITPFGKGLEPKIDPINNFGHGLIYKTCDGKDVATMEQVMQYNQMYYEQMMIKDDFEQNNGKHK